MDPGDNDGGGGAVRERGVKQLCWYGSHFHFLNGFFSLLCLRFRSQLRGYRCSFSQTCFLGSVAFHLSFGLAKCDVVYVR